MVGSSPKGRLYKKYGVAKTKQARTLRDGRAEQIQRKQDL
jgi:hypothetical protein